MPVLHELEKIAARRWWQYLLRGVLGVLLGIGILASPKAGLSFLVILFGIYAIADGAIALYMGFPKHFGLILAGGLSILAGILAFSQPLLTATALVFAIAAWAILLGVMQLFHAFTGHESEGADWMTALAGAAAIGLGTLILLNPGLGLMSVVVYAGGYAILAGVFYAILGLRLRGHRGDQSRLVPA